MGFLIEVTLSVRLSAYQNSGNIGCLFFLILFSHVVAHGHHFRAYKFKLNNSFQISGLIYVFFLAIISHRRILFSFLY